MSESIDTYESMMQSVREEVARDQALARLMSPQVSPTLLTRFLIEYCAQGVHVTEPVEGWIRRAGERCRALGLEKTGIALLKHAPHEAGHHTMFIDDARFLVERWNARGFAPLDVEGLLSQPLTDGMRDYIDLHEEVILSDAPYAQVAIEYEIERLSVDLLPSLMHNFQEKLGSEVMKGLSFLTEHAAIDVGHTQLNRKMLERLFVERPDALPALLRIGARALCSYMKFFAECLDAAEQALGQPQALAG